MHCKMDKMGCRIERLASEELAVLGVGQNAIVSVRGCRNPFHCQDDGRSAIAHQKAHIAAHIRLAICAFCVITS